MSTLKFSQTGFSNLGNTCFFNSILQCIMHSQPFVIKMLESEVDWNGKSRLQGDCYKTLKKLMKK